MGIRKGAAGEGLYVSCQLKPIPMEGIFFLLFFVSLIGLIVGLISPKLIHETLTRKRVGLYGGSAAFVFFVLFVAVLPPAKEDPETTAPEVAMEAQEEIKTVEEKPSQAVQEALKKEATTEQPASPTINIVTTELPTTSPTNLYSIKAVIDGDTADVEVAGVTTRIRMIGLNTPEVGQCYFQESKNKAVALLSGKSVSLEYDASQGEKDKYGRTLAYIFLQDGTNFQETMIRQGFAEEYTYSKAYKYQSLFKAAENEAKSKNLGIWGSACTSPSQPAPSEPVATPPPAVTTPSSYNCQSNTYNCTDFSSHEKAQAVYDYCIQQVGYDVHRLDSDDDGLACESL